MRNKKDWKISEQDMVSLEQVQDCDQVGLCKEVKRSQLRLDKILKLEKKIEEQANQWRRVEQMIRRKPKGKPKGKGAPVEDLDDETKAMLRRTAELELEIGAMESRLKGVLFELERSSTRFRQEQQARKEIQEQLDNIRMEKAESEMIDEMEPRKKALRDDVRNLASIKTQFEKQNIGLEKTNISLRSACNEEIRKMSIVREQILSMREIALKMEYQYGKKYQALARKEGTEFLKKLKMPDRMKFSGINWKALEPFKPLKMFRK